MSSPSRHRLERSSGAERMASVPTAQQCWMFPESSPVIPSRREPPEKRVPHGSGAPSSVPKRGRLRRGRCKYYHFYIYYGIRSKRLDCRPSHRLRNRSHKRSRRRPRSSSAVLHSRTRSVSRDAEDCWALPHRLARPTQSGEIDGWYYAPSYVTLVRYLHLPGSHRDDSPPFWVSEVIHY